jgi:hypothetical protein
VVAVGRVCGMTTKCGAQVFRESRPTAWSVHRNTNGRHVSWTSYMNEFVNGMPYSPLPCFKPRVWPGKAFTSHDACSGHSTSIEFEVAVALNGCGLAGPLTASSPLSLVMAQTNKASGLTSSLCFSYQNDTEPDLVPGLHRFPRLSCTAIANPNWDYPPFNMASPSATITR